MAVGKRKAPRKETGKRFAAALKGPDSLWAFSQRHEQERLEFLQGVAADLGLKRERFGSSLVWLFELAYRLASDQFASVGEKGRPPEELTVDDFQLWAEWNAERRKSNASDRRIAIMLIERISPWKDELEAIKSPVTGKAATSVKRGIAEDLRGRFRTVDARLGRIEKLLGEKT